MIARLTVRTGETGERETAAFNRILQAMRDILESSVDCEVDLEFEKDAPPPGLFDLSVFRNAPALASLKFVGEPEPAVVRACLLELASHVSGLET